MLQHAELGHQVDAMAFSPSNPALLAVALAQEQTLSLWDWESHTLLAKVKVGVDLLHVGFNVQTHHLVAAGKRHLCTLGEAKTRVAA